MVKFFFKKVACHAHSVYPNHQVAFMSFNVTYFRNISITAVCCLLFCATTAFAADQPRKISGNQMLSAEAVNQPASQQNDLPTPRTFGEPLLVVEDLSAELFADNGVLFVQGNIINKTHLPVKGYIMVNILDKNNMVITAYHVELKQDNNFVQGKPKHFESMLDVSSIKNMANVSLEFVNK